MLCDVVSTINKLSKKFHKTTCGPTVPYCAITHNVILFFVDYDFDARYCFLVRPAGKQNPIHTG